MEKALNVVGLVITLVGAAVTTWGVLITPDQAAAMTGAAIGTNPRMNEMLIAQSVHAAIGLGLIFVGTLLQLLAQFTSMPLRYGESSAHTLDRNDLIFLSVLTLAIIGVIAGTGGIGDASGWAQAIGTIAAVFGAAHIARRQQAGAQLELAQERDRRERTAAMIVLNVLRSWYRDTAQVHSDNDLYEQSKKSAGKFSTKLPVANFSHSIDRVADLPAELAQEVFDALHNRDISQAGIVGALEFMDDEEELYRMMEDELTKQSDQLSAAIGKLEARAGFSWPSRT